MSDQCKFCGGREEMVIDCDDGQSRELPCICQSTYSNLTAENKRLLEIEADARIRLDDRQERLDSLTAENKRLREALEMMLDVHGSILDLPTADINKCRAALAEREKDV